MGFRDSIARARQSLTEKMNVLLDRGPQVDEDFWEDLEEALILSDLGASAADEIVESLREKATRQALPDSHAVLSLLADTIAGMFVTADPDPFDEDPVCILFVGINGAGKTTTVGKLANQGLARGRKPLIGSADTFRAAAIEQLDEWGRRSNVEVVKRERGADPASVCYDVIERAEAAGSDLVLIDTSGRLHTSADLMRELEKVVNVTKKRSGMPVRTILVIDSTTGQNGLQQAREFDKALGLDGVIMTKLDGTAKGGIAVAVSHELSLPILRVGVGEGIEDLQLFNPREYAQALFGDMTGAEDLESEEDAVQEDLEPAFEGESEVEEAAIAEESETEEPETGEEPQVEEAYEESEGDEPEAADGPEETEEPEEDQVQETEQIDEENEEAAEGEESEEDAEPDQADEEPAAEEEQDKKKWWRFW